MRVRTFLLFVIVAVSSVYCFAQEKAVPEPVLEGLRQQMKEMKTLKANYSVDTINYQLLKKEIQFRVTLINSGDKYNLSELVYDSNEQIQEARYVYDGIEMKFFHFYIKQNKREGSLFPKSFNEISLENDLCQFSGFNIIRSGYDKYIDQSSYKKIGREIVNGHECTKILVIMPYKPQKDAYKYFWIETIDDKYYLIKDECLIEDNPNLILYENRFDYDYSDDYPIPRKIYYERFEIDDNGNRTPEYKTSVVVKDFEVNIPVADNEFVYLFPEGTLVDNTSASIDPKELLDPNRPKNVTQLKNIIEVDQLPQDNRTVFPFDVNCGELLLPALIHGKAYSFLLDTGASHSILDASLKDFLGAPKKTMTAGTLGNPMVIQMFESPLIQIGPFDLPKNSDISCLDLSMLSMVNGKTINGVLGMDFLKNHAFQIDFDKGFISFLKEDEIDISSFDQELEITFDRLGWPNIKGKIINQIDAEFVVDSGDNSSGSMDRDTFEKLMSLQNMKISETLAVTASGSQSLRLARVESLKIGNYEYKDSLFTEGSYCNLGLVFLSRHIVVFDFPKRKMYLKKSQKYNMIDENDMSGLHLLRISGNTVVYSIDKNSPADKNGITSGDIIVKIEGKDTAGLEMSQVRKILKSGNGKEITLNVDHNHQLKEILLILEKKI